MDKMLMLDVETAGSIDLPLVYDFGAQTIDMTGEAAGESFNHVMLEVFYGMKDEMEHAYFAEKIPQYDDDIWSGDRDVMEFMQTRNAIARYLKDNGINKVCAHNARFDINALNHTIRVLTGNRVKYFLPYGVEVWDTLKLARQVLLKMPEYWAFCKANGYMTKHSVPRPRLTAEVIYRFITNDLTFEEAHTGLRDVEIESQILGYLLAHGAGADPILYHAPAN